MKVNYNRLYPFLGLTILLGGCQGNTPSSSDFIDSGDSSKPSNDASLSSSSEQIVDPNNPNYYHNVENRSAFDATNELNFVDDLKGGLNNDVWWALDGAWHTEDAGAPHNGVRRRNLFYTKDSDNNDYLAIKGRGYYNTEDSKTANLPEGGVIVTKNHLTPGRYEIQMAAHPREGAVTAMWTYCTVTGNELTSQNEIDIEIGGTTSGNQFEHLWSTTWTKKTNKETKAPKVSDQLYLNDGKIHKYSFDWYTNYMGTGVKRIDWFIDEVYLTSITGEVVPEHNMPLWVGLWFPPRWAGNPSFVNDYLLVKEISFTAFESLQWYEDCRAQPGYTKVNIADAGIQTIPFAEVQNINKLSNGDFESDTIFDLDGTYYGWEVDTASKGSFSLSNEKTTGNHSFKLTASKEIVGKYNGEYLKQTLTNAYPGYEFDFSIDAKREDNASVGNIEIVYRNNIGSKIDEKIIPVTSNSFSTYREKLVVPHGATKIEITITAETNSIYYDNANLTFLKAA